MTARNLVSLLVPLCETDPPEITWQAVVEQGAEKEYETLIELGALVAVGNTDKVLCLGCDEPHPICVEYVSAGTYRAFCPHVGYQLVQANVLRRFAVDVDWLATSVASALGLASTRNARAPSSSPIVRVGRARFGPYACELFVGCRLLHKERFEAARGVVSGWTGKAPAIILTTTPLSLVAGEPPARSAVLALGDVLKITSSIPSVEEGPIYAVLRGQAPRFQSEAIGYHFSLGFRSAWVGDKHYHFTDKQALAIEALHEAWKRGGDLHQDEIKGAADTNQRVGQLFKAHPAYGHLVKHVGGGFYTLDL